MNRRHLWAMARAAEEAGTAPAPLVTIVTSPSGERYAAWDVGVVLLPTSLFEDLDEPEDGTYRMFTAGGLRAYDGYESFTPGFVRDRMLPLLDRPDRTRVEDSRGMCEVEPGTVHRIITGPKSTAVRQDLWAAWTAVTAGTVWKLGHPSGGLVWAAEDARATALLLPVRLPADTTPPAMEVRRG